MTLEELKQSLECNQYTGQSIVFVTRGNTFIPFQYVKRMAKIQKLSVKVVDSIDEIISEKLDIFGVDDSQEYLTVVNVDDFNYTNTELLTQHNIIIIAKIIKDSATQQLFKDIIIECPKLESWQLKSYLYSNGKGIAQNKLDWLLSLCKDDIFRLDQEISKINIFTESERKYVFDEFVENGIFDDLTSSSIFNLVNAITGKDRKKLLEIYQDINNIDISEFGLITILYNNFRNIINIQLGSNPTPEKLGISPKQFAAVRYSCGKYTAKQLADIFEFLTQLDFKVKTGQLPADIIVDYIIQRILSY